MAKKKLLIYAHYYIPDAMMWFDKFSCKRSDLVITVGRDLVETVENRFRGKKVPKTVMINNWIDENEIYPLDENNERVVAFKKKYGLDGKFVIMYSGNIGLYYDLENLIKVVEKIKPCTRTGDGREVVFAFVGAGSVLDKLVLYVKEHHMDNVTFIPYQDKVDLIYSLNAGDVHWCVNAKGIKGVSWITTNYVSNIKAIHGYEKEYDRMEQDNERLADHQRSVLCNIRDEVDALDTLLQDTRLNRRRMQGAVRIIQQMINREL